MIRKLIALSIVLGCFALAGCTGPQKREVVEITEETEEVRKTEIVDPKN